MQMHLCVPCYSVSQLVSQLVSQGSAGFPFPGKNGKEMVDFPPFSLPNGKFILFPSHILPLLIILNIFLPLPPQTNSTQHFLPISFPYHPTQNFLPIPTKINYNKKKSRKTHFVLPISLSNQNTISFLSLFLPTQAK